MDARHRGLTANIAGGNEEAARVCLDRHHIPPQEFTLTDDRADRLVNVEWAQTDTRIKDAWANNIDTTEAGAYCCVLAAVELAHGLVALKRMQTKSGADYYVGPANQSLNDLEDCYRLEVSGTNLDERHLRSVLKNKVQQTKALPKNNFSVCKLANRISRPFWHLLQMNRQSNSSAKPKDGNSDLPALAGVIGFKVRHIFLETVTA